MELALLMRIKSHILQTSYLVNSVVFWAQLTTRDYIRAEGDFPEEMSSWKDQ